MKTKPIITLATGLCLALIVSARGQASFTKITTGPIVTDRGQFAGAAWGDFHGLGFLDLVVCDYGGGTNVFYRNNGDGAFAKANSSSFRGGSLRQRPKHPTRPPSRNGHPSTA